jgi:hypothetical protein
MKTNFLKHILLLVVFTTIVSCSKDNATPTEAQYRIKQVDFANGDNKRYEYNSQNQITKITTGNVIETNTYDANGFLIQNTATGAAINTDDYITTFTNDANGLVLQKIIEYQNGGTAIKWEYINANGKRQSEKSFGKNNNTWVEIPVDARTYNYDASGNLIESLGTNVKYTYSYDDRNNVLSEKYYTKASNNFSLSKTINYTYDNVKPSYYTNSVLSKNNITKKQVISLVGGNNIDDGRGNYSYEYNQYNYITKTYKEGVLFSTNILEKIN